MARPQATVSEAPTKAPKAAARAKPSSTGALALARAACKKILKDDQWRVSLDPDFLTKSHAHCATGSFVIDYLIGGEPNQNGVAPCPGVPRGKLTQVWGAEGSGKTTLALTLSASVIANGGTVLYVDWENDIVPDYAAALGVPVSDPDKFELVQPDSLEDGMKIIMAYVLAGVDLVVIDSVGAAVPKAIKERGADEAGEQQRVGLLAQRWSEFLPDIKGLLVRHNTAMLGISQVRQKLGGGAPGMSHGPTTQPQGGEAWKFYSALRIEFRRLEQEKENVFNVLNSKREERVIGSKMNAKLVKCKLSKAQGREAVFYIRQGSGIDDMRSVMEIGIAHNLISKGGAWYQYGEKRCNGMVMLRKYFVENPDVFGDLVSKVRPFLSAKSNDPVVEDDEDELDMSLLEGGSAVGGPTLESFVAKELDIGLS